MLRMELLLRVRVIDAAFMVQRNEVLCAASVASHRRELPTVRKVPDCQDSTELQA